MRHRLLLGVSCAVVFGTLMGGYAFSSGGGAVEGVSSVNYGPKPFYNDLSRMFVRFKATGPARPGREYWVSLQIFGPAADSLECTDVAVSSDKGRGHVVRRRGFAYKVVLRGYEPITGTRYFCKGPAVIWVGASSIRSPSSKTTRIYRKVRLRILPAP